MPAVDAWRDAIATPDHESYTYDLAEARNLDGAERDAARGWLLARARDHHDVRAVETLAALGWGEALDELRELQGGSGSGAIRAAAARAVVVLAGDDAAVSDVAAQLSRDPLSIDAAYTLSRSNHPAAWDALLPALSHGDSVVRFHAFDGLVRMAGLEAQATPRQAPLATLKLGLANDLPSVHRRAADTLRDLFQRARTGASPSQLRLIYSAGDVAALARFIDQIDPDVITGALDIHCVEALTGHDRAWADALLLGRINLRDPRIPAALVALVHGRDALVEVLAADAQAARRDAFHDAAQAALRIWP